MAYVGTFSSPLGKMPATQVDLPPGNGRGIHLFRVNRETGALQEAGVVEMGTSPNCIAINAKGDRLYTTNETDKAADGESGTVSAFAIDRSTGQLTMLNTVSTGAHGPTHISLHPSGKFAFVANYFGGALTVLPIASDGKVGPFTDLKKDTGKIGPTRATHAPPGSFAFSGHDNPHTHQAHTDPSGRYVITAQLAMDQIKVWKFDAENGKLMPNEPAFVSLPPGDGPRHFAIHPNGKWFYSLQEEGSTVVLFDWNGERGTLTSRQTLSSLPPGYAGSNFTSEIMVSPDGKFVYAANRLHDGISWFAIGEDGTLTFKGEEWTRGDYPRSFNFDPTGKFLYSCNQRADNVTVFRVDKSSGALQFTGQYVPVGNPSFIAFLELE